MKKKVALLVATALLIAGLALMATTLFLVGFDFTKFETVTYTETTFDLVDGFTALDIRVDDADVQLLPTTDGSFKVVCNDRETLIYSATVTDGKLTVSYTDARTLADYIGFFFRPTLVTVYAPAGAYEALVINGSTGDVEIPSDFSFTSVSVAIGTGDISCRACATGEINLTTTTGDVDINGVTAGSITVNTTTGDVDGARISCADAISVGVTTGDVELCDLACRSLAVSGSSGDLSLVDVVAQQRMKIVRTTGDVELVRVDAEEIDIKTGTGDVSGTIRTAKHFDADASTGDVRIPENGTGGTCKIRTSTGDIFIRLSAV